jgi:hypothetical protein
MRLVDFHVGLGFLALAGHAAHGGEKLEIMFPPKLPTGEYQKGWNALV